MHYRTRLKTSVFAYQDQVGWNCLISAFQLMGQYENLNGNYPEVSTGLFTEIEATVEYLIQLAEQHDLDMRQILNHKTKNGTTLFWQAASFSEKLAKILLEKNVEVKTVDNIFMTPQFRVSKIFLQCSSKSNASRV